MESTIHSVLLNVRLWQAHPGHTQSLILLIKSINEMDIKILSEPIRIYIFTDTIYAKSLLDTMHKD